MVLMQRRFIRVKEHSLLGLLKMDLYRAFSLKRYWGSVLGITLLCILNSKKELHSPDVLFLLLYVRRTIVQLLSFILCAIPYGTGICEDTESLLIKCILTRSNYLKYVISKVLLCSISAFFTYFNGIILFILYLRVKYPLIDKTSSIYYNIVDSNPIMGRLLERNTLYYFILFIIASAMLRAMMATLSLLISTKITNKFVTIALPVLCYYFMTYAMGGSGIFYTSPKFQISIIFALEYPVFETIGTTFGYSIIIFILWTGLMIYLIYKNIRRMHYE